MKQETPAFTEKTGGKATIRLNLILLLWMKVKYLILVFQFYI